jgi:hypothetical protein
MTNAMNRLLVERILNWTYEPQVGTDGWRDHQGKYYTTMPDFANTFLPSTRLQDTWQIVDAISDKHSIIIENMVYDTIQYRCIINRREYPFGATCDSASIVFAICMSLLRVFQVSEEEIAAAIAADSQ